MTSVRDFDFRLAIASEDGTGESLWCQWVHGGRVVEDGLDKGRNAGGVAVIEIFGYGKDLVRGRDGHGDLKIGARRVRIAQDKMRCEESRQYESDCGQSLALGGIAKGTRHSDCSRMTQSRMFEPVSQDWSMSRLYRGRHTGSLVHLI